MSTNFDNFFGRKMAKRLKLCEVHSLSNSLNLRHHTTTKHNDFWKLIRLTDFDFDAMHVLAVSATAINYGRTELGTMDAKCECTQSLPIFPLFGEIVRYIVVLFEYQFRVK